MHIPITHHKLHLKLTPISHINTHMNLSTTIHTNINMHKHKHNYASILKYNKHIQMQQHMFTSNIKLHILTYIHEHIHTHKI